MAFIRLVEPPIHDSRNMLISFDFGSHLEEKDEQDLRDKIQNSIIWIVRSLEPYNLHSHKIWYDISPTSIESFMLGRRIDFYTPYVGGRKYNWLDVGADTGKLQKFIMYCINLEAAFYENPLCIRYIERQRKQQFYWMSGKIEKRLTPPAEESNL